jgi:DNA primase
MENRGLDRGIIERFELGVSPQDGQSLAKHLSKVGYTPQQQASAGVVRTTDSGQIRDLFRGRLMIPIRDGQARLAGFGGRALDDSTPKYLNSPRGPVFDKGRLLYAYHLARSNASRDGAVIVEGYMDAIAAYQHGFDNVVASMGTALTEHQVAEIRRLTNRVTMALDRMLPDGRPPSEAWSPLGEYFKPRWRAECRGPLFFNGRICQTSGLRCCQADWTPMPSSASLQKSGRA